MILIRLYLNKTYDYFAKQFNNLDTHRYEIKQEIIAKVGLFIAKKNYTMKIINDNGIKVDKVMTKGMSTVRSNFAVGFRDILKAVIEDILVDVPKDKIDSRILNFKNSIGLKSMDHVATPTGVKNLTKYQTQLKGNMKTHIKGTPSHVKASIAYNNLIYHFGKEKIYTLISNGDKIKWVWLKNNPMGMRMIAFKGYEDPIEIIKYIKEYVDYKEMYDRNFLGKVEKIYGALKWDMPIDKKYSLERFFNVKTSDSK